MMKLFITLIYGVFVVLCSGVLKAENAGVLDTSFVPMLFSSGEVQVTARAASSQLLVGGSFDWISGQPAGWLARLNQNGSVDESFAPVEPPDCDRLLAVVSQADGKVLVGYAYSARVHPGVGFPGQLITPSAVTEDTSIIYSFSGAKVIRLNPDGTVDSAFPAIGLELPSVSTSDDPALSFILPSVSGKILVGGNFTAVNGAPISYLACFNADGTVDKTFSVTVNGPVESALRQGDGSTVIGGQFTQINGVKQAFGMAKLNKGNARDKTFVPKGKPRSGRVAQISVGAGSTLLISSLTETLVNGVVQGDSQCHLEMVSATGVFMRTYAANISGRPVGLALTGSSQATLITSCSPLPSVIALKASTPWAPGYTVFASVSSSASAKVFAPLTVALTYRPNGLTHTVAGTMAYGFSGNDSAATPSLSGFQVVQRPVASSAAAPKATALPAIFPVWVGTSAVINQVAESPGSKLLVAGDFSFGMAQDGSLVTRRGLAKLASSGRVDASFAPPFISVNQFLANADGGATIIGTYPPVINMGFLYDETSLFQLTGTGAMDPSFHTSSATATPVLYASTALTRQLDGKLVVGSDVHTIAEANSTSPDVLYAPVLQRFLVDGTLDPGFLPGFSQSSNSRPASVSRVRLDTDGALLVSGTFDSVNGISRANVVRLLLDGSVDARKLGISPPYGFMDVLPRAGGSYLITAPFLHPNWPVLVTAGQTAGVSSPASTEQVTTSYTSPFLGTLGSGAADAGFSVPDLGFPTTVSAVFVPFAGYGVKWISPTPAGGWIAMTSGMNDQVQGTAASLVHVNTDGSLDRSFDAPIFASKPDNLWWWNRPNAPADYINGMVVLQDGSVVVAGSFWSVNGEGRSGLAKLRLAGRTPITVN